MPGSLALPVNPALCLRRRFSTGGASGTLASASSVVSRGPCMRKFDRLQQTESRQRDV